MKIVSLFAGCGGLDLGFERAGFEVIWANEYDKTIYPTYRHNHPNTTLNTQDIRKLTEQDIPDCDGIIGGPPCQSWSEGGKQKGIQDPRGQLFFDFIRIVKLKRPKFFLIENVKGILHEKHKDALAVFLKLLEKAEYNITYKLLNAADYNIPQDRARVFFVGIRKDLKNNFIFPEILPSKKITLKQAIGDIVTPPTFCTEKSMPERNNLVKNHDVYIGPFDAKYMARNRVRSWDETSFTMQAQARNIPIHPQAPKMTYINSHKYIFTKGYEYLYRRLSVRECARIQTFPDKFVFIYNNILDGYKMVGNAVPPRLAWYLAVQIKHAFADVFLFNKPLNTDSIKKSFSPSKININTIKDIYSGDIIKNEFNPTANDIILDSSKKVLICLIKPDYIDSFTSRNAKIYYTGDIFPKNITLNNLYYFIPYIKNKGIKDIYLIKRANIGLKKEIGQYRKKNDYRIFFEIEFIKQMFNEYLPIHLNIWHTYTDITIGELMELNEIENMR